MCINSSHALLSPDVFPVQGNDPVCRKQACNIERVCYILLDDSIGSLLDRLALLVNISTGGECLDVSYDNYVAQLLNTTLMGGVERIWTYQTCAEFGFYQTCDPGSQCPFISHPHLDDLQYSLDFCTLAFNITPDQVYI